MKYFMLTLLFPMLTFAVQPNFDQVCVMVKNKTTETNFCKITLVNTNVKTCFFTQNMITQYRQQNSVSCSVVEELLQK